MRLDVKFTEIDQTLQADFGELYRVPASRDIPPHRVVSGGFYSLSSAISRPANKTFCSANTAMTGRVSCKLADYEWCDGKYYPRAFQHTAALREGETLYIVFDPRQANGEYWPNNMVEWYMHITREGGTEMATFQRNVGGYGAGLNTKQGQHGLVYSYSYVDKADWRSYAPERYLLDNYAELEFAATGGLLGMDNTWIPAAGSPVSDVAFGLVNLWGGGRVDVGDRYIPHLILRFVAPKDGTYTVDAFGALRMHVYVLQA